jgi:hypothetical protein
MIDLCFAIRLLGLGGIEPGTQLVAKPAQGKQHHQIQQNIYTNSMSHNPTTHTPKSHVHSFRILSIIRKAVAYNFSIIKSTRDKLFLLPDSHDLKTNNFF